MPEPGFTAVCFLMPIHNRSLKTQLLPAQSFICSHVWIRGCRIFLRCTWAQPFRTSTYIWIWRCYLWTLDGGSRSSFFFYCRFKVSRAHCSFFFSLLTWMQSSMPFFSFIPPSFLVIHDSPLWGSSFASPPLLMQKGGRGTRATSALNSALLTYGFWLKL